MRLFVAVDFSADAKRSIGAAVGPIRKRFPTARWVSPDRFHLTLAFLGELAESELHRAGPALREKLEQEEGFRGALGEPGTFPPAGKVNVLWLGLQPAERFSALSELVREALTAAGIPFDTKPFRPHLTLARCAPPWPARTRDELATIAPTFRERLAPVAIDCEGVSVFSSRPGAGGPVYRSELEIGLAAAPGASLAAADEAHA